MDTIAGVRVARARAAMRAIKIIGEDLLGEAQRRAPLEEGTLRGSGVLYFLVNGARLESYEGALAAAIIAARAGNLNSVDAEVAFTTIYAARQHEETDWNHPLSGEAKYLERPLQERAGRYTAVMNAAVDRALT